MTPDALALAELAYREARLLDAQRYDEWYALFADDALYWVPLAPDQAGPASGQSIACEDKLLLRIRIERTRNPKAYSMRERPVSQHVLQAPAVLVADASANRYVTEAPFVYVEARGDDQVVLAGRVTHQSRVEGGALRIVQKRVDLVNAGAALPPVFLLL